MNEFVAGPGSSGGAPSVVGQRLHAVLDGERVVEDLRRYFGIGLPPGAGVFTGGRFEHLAGGGDRRQVVDRFTAEDLVAVQTLSVTVPAPVALDLLEGPLGTQLSELLRGIPSDTDLSDADASIVADGSPAYRAWCLLEDQYKIGWVIAGKLLARKRPRLLPVYDRVVRCALGHPPSFWTDLRTALREDDAALHHRLLGLRQSAGLPAPAFARRYGFDPARPARWEVEALEPDELRRLVLAAADPYVDRTVLARQGRLRGRTAPCPGRLPGRLGRGGRESTVIAPGGCPRVQGLPSLALGGGPRPDASGAGQGWPCPAVVATPGARHRVPQGFEPVGLVGEELVHQPGRDGPSGPLSGALDYRGGQAGTDAGCCGTSAGRGGWTGTGTVSRVMMLRALTLDLGHTRHWILRI